MERELRAQQITEFLTAVGQQMVIPAQLILVGGGALSLLGSERPTLDLDFEGEEHGVDELRATMETVARELYIELEAVPFHRFIPIPAGASERHVPVGRFGALHVLVFDPYSIALSKLDRGFDADIEDVAFLLRRGFVNATELATLLSGLTREMAAQYDLDVAQMRVHLDLARSSLSND